MGENHDKNIKELEDWCWLHRTSHYDQALGKKITQALERIDELEALCKTQDATLVKVTGEKNELEAEVTRLKDQQTMLDDIVAKALGLVDVKDDEITALRDGLEAAKIESFGMEFDGRAILVTSREPVLARRNAAIDALLKPEGEKA